MLDHAESIIKGKKNNKVWLGIFGALIGAALVSAAAIIFWGWPALFLSAVIFLLACYFSYNLFLSANVEYEYAIYGGTLEITAIKGQRKRKKVFECEVKEIGGFGAVTQSDISEGLKAPSGDEKRIDCTGTSDDGIYSITAKNSDGVSCRVYIQPEGNILELLKQDNFEVRRYFMKNEI